MYKSGIFFDRELVNKYFLSQNMNKGFTAIELMVIVAVIAILSALAIPSLQGRTIRIQIEESLALADVAKKPVNAAWANEMPLPSDNHAAGIPAPEKIVGNYVSSVAIQNGAVHMTFGNRAQPAIAGKKLSLRPAVVPDAPVVPITWVCGKAEAPKNTVLQGEDQTTVPDSFLPLACRQLRK